MRFYKPVLFLLCASLFSKYAHAQDAKPKTGIDAIRPRLVVAIVVDQMRYDYLYKYYDKYSFFGIRKLMNEGYNCRNVHYNYVPTYTGPGHASIFTGTTPSIHGIIGNDWYSRTEDAETYCVTDIRQKVVGPGKERSGKMSPDNLLTSTIGDELKLNTNSKSKVIGLSIKDRGAILPAGHAPNAAYWFDAATGNFITSTYYMNDLPQYVKTFNAQRLADNYIKGQWKPLLGDVNLYTESAPDNNDFELPFEGENEPVFPHNLSAIYRKDENVISKTPFGNTILKDFAKEVISNENLGQNPRFPDFLSISFSSTDYVGHQFGPQSVELEDTYLRLDKDIEDLLNFLNNKVGKNNYVIMLTADHGVQPTIKQMDSLRIPSWTFDNSDMKKKVSEYIGKTYGLTNWVAAYSNSQVYLNYYSIKGRKESYEDVEKQTVDYFNGLRGVYYAYKKEEILKANSEDRFLTLIKNGYHPTRSGDVAVLLRPGWTEAGRRGTTHGSPYEYDTHVPVLFYGWKVNGGESSDEPYYITDVAPTLCEMLKITAPNGCSGKQIKGVVKY